MSVSHQSPGSCEIGIDPCEASNLIGCSAAFTRVIEFVRSVAHVDVPVLIVGETGTGKELVARALHYLSPRSRSPFVPVNCGALPDSVFENELFGHERGAYTDARHPYQGLVAQAQGGTLLLDEVDSLSPRAQVVLLRFLQDHQYRPLGSSSLRTANVRVVAATNASLADLTNSGRFRRDLFFRLDVAAVVVPPLRDRREDILLLARHFLRRYAETYGLKTLQIDQMIEHQLMAHAWPGNVRELENAMHRAVLLARNGVVCGPLSLGIGTAAVPPLPPEEFLGSLKAERARRTRDFERRYLVWLLVKTCGNVSAAARASGTERRHLGRLIRRHGIDPVTFRSAADRVENGLGQ